MLCPWSLPRFGGGSTVDRTPILRPRLLRTTNRGHTVTTRVFRNAPESASMVTPNTPAGDLACPAVLTASVANGCEWRQDNDTPEAGKGKERWVGGGVFGGRKVKVPGRRRRRRRVTSQESGRPNTQTGTQGGTHLSMPSVGVTARYEGGSNGGVSSVGVEVRTREPSTTTNALRTTRRCRPLNPSRRKENRAHQLGALCGKV